MSECQSNPPPDPQPAADYQRLKRYTVQDAAARGALCNDGTPAIYYYRNCTANGDRKPGDPTDYCAKGGEQGVLEVRWMIYLDPLGDAGWCHDTSTCAARPNFLKSSANAPSWRNPSGLLSPYPEANPNFYKQHTVIIPSCSSDLFLGDRVGPDSDSGLYFAGRRIVQAVLEDLGNPAMQFDGIGGPLQKADTVVLAGGVGAALLSSRLPSWLPNTSTTVSTICDDCMIPSGLDESLNNSRCTNDATCPPTSSLVLAAPRWNISHWISCGQDISAWQCLLADHLLPRLGRVFVLNPQLSLPALRMYGVDLDTATGRRFSIEYSDAIRKAAASAANAYISGCLAINTSATSLISSDFFFFHQLNCTSAGGSPFVFEPIQAVGLFLQSNYPGAPGIRCVASESSLVPCG